MLSRRESRGILVPVQRELVRGNSTKIRVLFGSAVLTGNRKDGHVRMYIHKHRNRYTVRQRDRKKESSSISIGSKGVIERERGKVRVLCLIV